MGNSSSSSDNQRSRLITWEDPAEIAKIADDLPGMKYLELMMENRYSPPISKLLNFQLISVEKGKATFKIEPAEYHYNPGNVVHGGVAATILDAAMACAIHSLLPPKHFCTTIELKINYLRPIIIQTGSLRAESEIIHFGGRTAVAQGKLLDKDSKLYAYSSATFMILQTTT
ncbi:MAG: PaaI family thioesterase [Acidobacteria bacterium]|nr:PaaI family thioesterase [Acidobacteriota bacterium]